MFARGAYGRCEFAEPFALHDDARRTGLYRFRYGLGQLAQFDQHNAGGGR